MQWTPTRDQRSKERSVIAATMKALKAATKWNGRRLDKDAIKVNASGLPSADLTVLVEIICS